MLLVDEETLGIKKSNSKWLIGFLGNKECLNVVKDVMLFWVLNCRSNFLENF